MCLHSLPADCICHSDGIWHTAHLRARQCYVDTGEQGNFITGGYEYRHTSLRVRGSQESLREVRIPVSRVWRFLKVLEVNALRQNVP